MSRHIRTAKIVGALATSVALLAACSSGNSDTPEKTEPTSSVVSTDELELIEDEGSEVEVVNEEAVAEAIEAVAGESEGASVAPEVEDITASDAPSLASTSWSGTSTNGSNLHNLVFDATGNVVWFESGFEYPNSTWNRVGDDVFVTVNNGFAVGTGTVKDDTISLNFVTQNNTSLSIVLKKD